MSVQGYMKQVEKKVDEIRVHLLGLDIPFWHFLPEHGAGMDEEKQIRWLTDRISFMLVSGSPWTSVKDVEFTWRWLYGMIRYLHETCPKSDWNFYSVVRLSKMDQRFRETVFWRREEYLAPLRAPQPPALLNSLETAVVELAGENFLRTRINTIPWGKSKDWK